MSEDLTQLAVTWRHTGDAEFPYTADVRGKTYTIRLNDFPAEPLYTLISEGNELQDLEDWPSAWLMPPPPKALLDLIKPKVGLRCDGAVRLMATSEPGEPVQSLALERNEIIAGSMRRLDLVTLQERPPEAHEAPRYPTIDLDGVTHERILAIAPEHAVAISTFASEGGHGVRHRNLRSSKTRDLAVGQRAILGAAIAPDGRSIIVLDKEGRVLRYDLATGGFPASAAARKPPPGRRVCLAVAPGGRLWLAASGGCIEARMMNDAKPLASVDLSSIGEDVTSVLFLPDGRGFLAGTSGGVVRRLELLVDRPGASREARIAMIADAVDAAIAGTRWRRYQPRVEVFDERSGESGTTMLSFVADHCEYHHAQSGSDWTEHVLCAGHATFDGERCVEVRVTTTDARRIIERDSETYDCNGALAAFRANARAG